MYTNIKGRMNNRIVEYSFGSLILEGQFYSFKYIGEA